MKKKNDMRVKDLAVKVKLYLSESTEYSSKTGQDILLKDVERFINTLSEKSIDNISSSNNNKIKELSNSIARSINSFDSIDQAIKNFVNLDKSKFETDKTIGHDIIEFLNNHKNVLNYSKKLDPKLVGTVLATKNFGGINNHEGQEMVVALTSAMISKIFGSDSFMRKGSPFVKDSSIKQKGINSDILIGVADAAIYLTQEINKLELNKSDQSLSHHDIIQDCISIGKNIGKETREELYMISSDEKYDTQDLHNAISRCLTSECNMVIDSFPLYTRENKDISIGRE